LGFRGFAISRLAGFREIPRSRIILRYLQKPCHDAAPLWPPRLCPDPPPPAAEAVHIMTSSHDRHRRPRRLRLRYHLAASTPQSRVRAAHLLGLDEVPCIVLAHLTPTH